MRSNKIINKYLLYITLFILPWQTRNVINAVYFNDNFVEYSSTSIYLTDILIILVLFTWLPILIKRKKFNLGPKIIFWSLASLLLWMWISVIWADGIGLNSLVSIWMAGHFTLFSLFYLYLINSAKNIKGIIWPIIWGVVFQSILAIFQYFLNFSLGLKLIGESILDPAQSGIPVVIVEGMRRLRAHGSLPHANILGGILAIWSIVLFSWFYAIKKNWQHYLIWLAFVIFAIALVLSFSRGAWLALAIGLVLTIILVWRKYPKKIKWAIAPGLLSFLIIFSFAINQQNAILSRFNFDQPIESISIDSRQQQFNNFKTIFVKYPILGIGAGQYIPYLYKINQETEGWSYNSGSGNWAYDPNSQFGSFEPIHNIFLLVLSELGIVGFIIFIILIIGALREIFKDRKRQFILSRAVASAFVALLILGMFDHYIWTLQQGRLLWFIVLAFVAILSIQSGYNIKVSKS